MEPAPNNGEALTMTMHIVGMQGRAFWTSRNSKQNRFGVLTGG